MNRKKALRIPSFRAFAGMTQPFFVFKMTDYYWG